MLQVWPVIQQNSALAIDYMKDMLSMLFPDEAPKYLQKMQEDTSRAQLMQQMMAIIQSLIIDPQTGQMTEEAQPYAQQLQALQQQVQALSGGDSQGAGGASPQGMAGQPNNQGVPQPTQTGAGEVG